MHVLPTVDETVFGDMNGPVLYWGPATASPAALFSPAEKALLVRLRTRLAQDRAEMLADALTTLIDTPAAVVVG